MVLLAASGGDTVKLFDVSVKSGDPCSLNYTPSPGCQVNSIKWNHTNLVVASAGDDKKITLWRKNGQSMGTIPLSGSESGDNIEEAISSISFSNKTSRYLCSGGSGQVVRIWDLQRKRCIKWLKGHTGSISSAIYNCKDEHLASISTNGDLLVHNLASGARAAELKDPHGQMLRVLDYSRVSRHLLATAGDDGSVHLWDTTGRSPKVSWLKQHSAPTAGLSFSPSNDKMIATVGLDKKLYTFDSGTKRSSFCIAYEAPFTSLAFREDDWILAAGTSDGRVVFYDVRGKPQPFTVLRAYGHSEAVTSLCWQRSKPIDVNEKNCTADVALLGGSVEDSILMPDPLPSATLSSVSLSTTLSGPRRSSSAVESAFATTFTNTLSSSEETPHRSSLKTGGVLPRLHTRNYNFKDDMDVFSPLVDVQPITPALDKLWNEPEGSRKDQPGDKKISSLFSSRKFTLPEGVNDIHPIFDWKPGPASKQDDTHSSLPGSTPSASSRSDDSSSITPPEAWGGERLSDKIAHHRQLGSLTSRFSMSTSNSTSTSIYTGLQDPSASQSAMSYSTNASLISSLRPRDISSVQESSPGAFGHVPFSALSNHGSKSQANPEAVGPFSLNPSRRFTTYAERIGSSASFNDGVSASVGSPKTKKTGVETREELQNSLLARSDTTYAAEPGLLPTINGAPNLHQRTPQADLQPGSTNFTLQLFQHTLQETLSSFQKSIHEDVRNLHIEILRQFHMQETEVSGFMNTVVNKLDSLTEEIQDLKKENERLRQLL
ncbi:protein NEDD1 [Spinacia oleracea]|uniref:Protein NEDD1 n=1 Tax=Spinacia oleracea TaxID=3562 RepID=A0ABM3RJW7_SPIOL|nr:protein NEDD1 [Spinacia oleracea]